MIEITKSRGVLVFLSERVVRGVGFVAIAFGLSLATSVFAEDLRIHGSMERGFSGYDVSGVGDFNGDGFADFAITEPGSSPNGRLQAGVVYLVFGSTELQDIDLADFTGHGVRILGASTYDGYPASVAGAGDVNGDGFPDLVFGSSSARNSAGASSGMVYVVFGGEGVDDIDLANLAGRGFKIEGESAFDYVGFSVSGAGDVNGDGLHDLIVGAKGADPQGLWEAGQAYVVFGKASLATVDLAELGDGGFKIIGSRSGEAVGTSVSGAGDVNGDGLADLLVGAPRTDSVSQAFEEVVYVVFGKRDVSQLSLADLDCQGFEIRAPVAVGGTGLGDNIAAAGDVNGDGFADVILGASLRTLEEPLIYRAGEAFVVFGKPGCQDVEIDSLGVAGFPIRGASESFAAGISVAAAGDINGDGFGDVLVGATELDSHGSGFLVFGRPGHSPVDLANLEGAGQLLARGAERFDWLGSSLATAGDVDRNGVFDIVLGGRYVSSLGRTLAGQAVLVRRPAWNAPAVSFRAAVASGDASRSAIGSVGDGSDGGWSQSRAWINYVDGAGPTGDASMETVTLIRDPQQLPPESASVAWRFITDREGFSPPEVSVVYLDSELVGYREDLLQVRYASDGDSPFLPIPALIDVEANRVDFSLPGPGLVILREIPEVFAGGFEG